MFIIAGIGSYQPREVRFLAVNISGVLSDSRD